MAFLGKWTYVRGENMKEFLLAAGAPPEKAENAGTAQSTVECLKDGDFFIIRITGPKGNTIEQKFQPGVPFHETFAAIGKERQAVASVDGNKLTINGVEAGTVVETREVNGDEMICSLSKDGVAVVGKRFLKRV